MILIGNWLQFGSGNGKNQKEFNLFIHRNPLMGRPNSGNAKIYVQSYNLEGVGLSLVVWP